MATNQCVGPSLDIDENTGILDVRLAGAPAAAGVPTTGNGLRLDQTKGMWAPADHATVQIHGTKTDSYGAGVVINPGATRLASTLTVTVTNPSTTRQMLALVNFHVRESHAIAPALSTNAGYTGWGLLAGYDIGASTAAAVVLGPAIERRDPGVANAERTFAHSHTTSTHLTLPPGGSTQVRLQGGWACYDWGYVRCSQMSLEIVGIGVTL